jgi:hypothetical protein
MLFLPQTDHLLEIDTEKRIRGCFSLVHRGSSSFFLAPVLPCGSGQLEPRATDRSIYTHMILLYFPHQINVALGTAILPFIYHVAMAL